MNAATNYRTMGLTEEYTFGTLTIANSYGEQSSTQGKFAYRMKGDLMLILKWNAKRCTGVVWASERTAVAWAPGKRNNNAAKEDTTTYIGKCGCGYKTRKMRDGNVVISRLNEHQDETLHMNAQVEWSNGEQAGIL